MNNSSPIVKDLVLIGGGHSQLAVLKRFGMHPVPGVRVTLITRDIHTPYSGMLPGYIAGHYDYDQAHIDLRPLALFADARLIHAEVEGLDLDNQLIQCPDRPPIHYDVLSINIGSRPGAVHIPGAGQFSLPVKPINTFLQGWEQIQKHVISKAQNNEQPFQLALIGAGAAGVEMALATQHRLHQSLTLKGLAKDRLHTILLSNTAQILPTHGKACRQRFEPILQSRGIDLRLNHTVIEVQETAILCADKPDINADAVLWLTDAAAPAWPKKAGLQVDKKGFIAVSPSLQSLSHPNVFAAGDIAAVLKYPRPKAGVYAVRQGKPLAKNLLRALRGQSLKPYRPQSEALSLISTGDQYAIASRQSWSLGGATLWRWKNWIDLSFMKKFQNLPEMTTQNKSDIDSSLAGKQALQEISAMAMRCGGCGAKVGSTVLSRVVNRLEPIERDDVIIGLKHPDDAAVCAVPDGKLMVQSVDYFRSFIDDPYLFGQIASNHALSDIFAMGADPQSAMAIATLPYGIEFQVEDQLFQLMSGAVKMMNASGTALVGGHSSEGAELAFGLSVTGLVNRDQVLRKGGMQVGEVLILTKPLGTGTLFAADMRLKAKGRWIDAALQHMVQSNQQAGLCLHRHGASACTDVTGFGLLGHLVEMTRSSEANVTINLDALPIMEGALETIDLGIFSSLQDQNIRLRRAIQKAQQKQSHRHYPMLFDPQTSGGLLASIPAKNVPACVQELHTAGYKETCVIGTVVEESNALERVSLVSG